nr:hypothetical protein Hi04_10k_c5218_00004 [uncultured bacterium]
MSIQIATSLSLFTTVSGIEQIDRPFLIQFLESYRHCLSPDATTLLGANDNLTHPEFCSAWAIQFRLAYAFAPPLPQVLRAIETLARPENDHLIERVASSLPSGFAIGRYNGQLHQALHAWLLSQGVPGVTFPIPVDAPEPAGHQPKPGPAPEAASVPASPDSPPPEPAPPASPLSVPSPAAESDAPAFLDHPYTTATLSPPPLAPPATPPSVPPPLVPPASSPSAESDAAAFARLARLSPVEYDHVRRAEAKRLSLRLKTLDDAVEAARGVQADIEANEIHLSVVQPWHEPVTDAPALFDQVRQRVLVYLSLVPGADIVLTLWPPHAHAIGAFNITPHLNFTSIEPGCGKSTAMDLLHVLTPKVLRTDSLKTAVLFRVVDRHQPTLLLDELDTYLHLYPDLIGLLNAGNKLGASAHRCYGPHVRAFKAFAAIALAGIGHLPRTLRDRCIVIQMLKAEQGALQARLDERYLEPEKILGRKIARWVHDNFAAIAACDPVMPPAAYNRLGDKWRPLFAIAQTIGGHWPQLITDAFNSLSEKRAPHATSVHQHPSSANSGHEPMLHSHPNQSPPCSNGNPSTPSAPAAYYDTYEIDLHLLLSDIRQVFAAAKADRLFSSYLVHELQALPDRPWSGMHNGDKPLTKTLLGHYLATLGVHSRILTIGPSRARGYLLSSLPQPSQAALPPPSSHIDFQI